MLIVARWNAPRFRLVVVAGQLDAARARVRAEPDAQRELDVLAAPVLHLLAEDHPVEADHPVEVDC